MLKAKIILTRFLPTEMVSSLKLFMVESLCVSIGVTEVKSKTILNGKVVSESTINVEVEEIVQPSLYAYRKQGIIEHENEWTGKIWEFLYIWIHTQLLKMLQ